MELIKIRTSKSGKKVICARELHEFLESKRQFSNWINTQIEVFQFVQDVDFVKLNKFVGSDSKPKIEYYLSISMAKELSMVERNEQGKKARQYFIDCEEQLKKQVSFDIPQTYADALQLAADQTKKLEELGKQIEADRPRVEFSKSIEASSQSIKIGNFAKVISKEEGLTIGRNRLFAWLRNQKILQKDNLPYQAYIDRGWFEVKETSYLNADEVNLGFTTMVTGKGQVRLLNRYKTIAG